MTKQRDAFDFLIQQAETLLKIAAEATDAETKRRLERLAEDCRFEAERERKGQAQRKGED